MALSEPSACTAATIGRSRAWRAGAGAPPSLRSDPVIGKYGSAVEDEELERRMEELQREFEERM
ncbi:MAG: hypothetical protein ACE5EV_04670, partial [Gaiellales bacterium]